MTDYMVPIQQPGKIKQQQCQLSFLGVLNLVATSLYQLTPRAPSSLAPDGRRVAPPWDIVFIAGGAQAISRFTSECDLLGGLVRGVSDNFWQQRSPLMNQALLCLAICLLAEVSTADAIAEALLPLAHVVASRTDKEAQFFALPFALCASTNLVLPMSLAHRPRARLQGTRSHAAANGGRGRQGGVGSRRPAVHERHGPTAASVGQRVRGAHQFTENVFRETDRQPFPSFLLIAPTDTRAVRCARAPRF
ncbi:uncharacterized protein LOC119446180 [Dermacentor silvarum]|uniref:uncharacterized protein LOC119446180 n=1 Tax=Dermacentor silvarum TaxID=543639 RepID=UPI002100F7C0|nr:uncharacterized protein LOC119446180 [Dermacentor silvarum]